MMGIKRKTLIPWGRQRTERLKLRIRRCERGVSWSWTGQTQQRKCAAVLLRPRSVSLHAAQLLHRRRALLLRSWVASTSWKAWRITSICPGTFCSALNHQSVLLLLLLLLPVVMPDSLLPTGPVYWYRSQWITSQRISSRLLESEPGMSSTYSQEVERHSRKKSKPNQDLWTLCRRRSGFCSSRVWTLHWTGACHCAPCTVTSQPAVQNGWAWSVVTSPLVAWPPAV